MSAAELLRDYWYLMPVAIVLDALIWLLAGYGLWRGIRSVTGRRRDA